MGKDNYYIGLDIGTDSVGYAVTNDRYELCKYKGEAMWGVTLFDEAELAVARRTARVARRRLDRRQQRIRLLMELFAAEISKIDKDFYKRIKESYIYPATTNDKVRLFRSYEEQRKYNETYPTIHHLITELMNNPEPHDVRLVYIACAWLVAHRGHFLSDVDKNNVSDVTDFAVVWNSLTAHIKRGDYALPWEHTADLSEVENVLKGRHGISQKTKLLTKALFGPGKAPKVISEEHEYNYELVIKLLCGSASVKLKDLFGRDEYDDLEEKTVSLAMDDEKLASVLSMLYEDDAALITVLKGIYDWSVLVDILKGKTAISEAKIDVYNQHERDLRTLKHIIKTYVPNKYYAVFRSDTEKFNYAAYVGKNSTANTDTKHKKCKKEDFSKYILSIVKNVTPYEKDSEVFSDMLSRLETNDFLPKQVDGDNRVIPYQLYWYELNKVLENAKAYVPFLSEKDSDGITGAEKVLSVFEFRVPYYVGPLKENKEDKKKLNHWMVRKAERRIYPWNFNDTVDLDASEEAFIKRMTNSCTYLPGEDVLPKNSLVYCAFEVLNEINNITIEGKEIPITAKQGIYNDLFMKYDRVTPKHIKQYLASNNYAKPNSVISGIDITVKSTLKPFRAFRNLVLKGLLSYSDVESIINRATYSEDKKRFSEWVKREYPTLPESEVKYISTLKFKEFGRLSKKILCDIEGAVNPTTGEYMSVIRSMWETNYNFMELMTDKFGFADEIQRIASEYYIEHPKSISERLDDMQVSNAVKRPIIRTLDIIKDIKKVRKNDPKMIFIEMARGSNEDTRGKRTVTRLQQLRDLYSKIDSDEVRELQATIDGWGDIAHSKLQSDKLFLYFVQLGKCLYTGKSIPIESVISGDGVYNIEHIYPRSFVKDDSVLNNKILVDSKANGEKSDSYPISGEIREKMSGYWSYLHKNGLLTDEKYKRLTRTTPFTEDEKYEFINRQLVETRQSTKAVSVLLKEMLPETEIVYVKAGLVSDFRQKFDVVKCRSVNDLHHAKDAYLNIVVGNVWHHKFSKRFYIKNADNNVKPEIVFTRPVHCGNKQIWAGAEDKDRVIKIAKKNTAHITYYSYIKHSGQNGGFFDQNPVKAKAGLIPLKKGMPTEIYGGYDSATVAGFVLARYRLGKKTEISFVPLKLMFLKKYLEDKNFANEYVKEELGEKAKDIDLLLNGRIIKIFTTISLDGARFCIRGKGNAVTLGLMNIMPFKADGETEAYIKKLERFVEKSKTNDKLVWNEKHDKITSDENLKLYDTFVDKLGNWPYNKRPGGATLREKLIQHRKDFDKVSMLEQAKLLLGIIGILGRMKQVDLSTFKESTSSGVATISLNLSNLKKSYSDVRIVDTSASGLYEKVSENLIDLL